MPLIRMFITVTSDVRSRFALVFAVIAIAFAFARSQRVLCRAAPCHAMPCHGCSGRLQAGLGDAERSVSSEVEGHTHPTPEPRSCLGALHRDASAVAQDESQVSNAMEYSDPNRTANDHTSRGGQTIF